jgi:hypothetical protein
MNAEYLSQTLHFMSEPWRQTDKNERYLLKWTCMRYAATVTNYLTLWYRIFYVQLTLRVKTRVPPEYKVGALPTWAWHSVRQCWKSYKHSLYLWTWPTETSDIPSSKSHIHFLLPGFFQRTYPGLRHYVTFHKKSVFMVKHC